MGYPLSERYKPQIRPDEELIKALSGACWRGRLPSEVGIG
jgi:hypothetical protein